MRKKGRKEERKEGGDKDAKKGACFCCVNASVFLPRAHTHTQTHTHTHTHTNTHTHTHTHTHFFFLSSALNRPACPRLHAHVCLSALWCCRCC